MAGPIATLAVRLSAQIAEFQKSFEDAIGTVSQFERKFAGSASSIEQHTQDIKKAFASFAGDNVTRQANVLATAIAQVGGASKLTAAEQARANAQLKEAIEKYKVLGETAPKAILELEQATRKIPAIPKPAPGLFDEITKSAVTFGTGLVTVTAAVGAVTAAFAIAQRVIGGTFDLIKGSLDDTAALGDKFFTLSQQTGLSVEALSSFQFVAEQTGTSLDSITAATFKLSANIGKGGKEMAESLRGIGLSLADLKKQTPEAAFTNVIAGLEQIPNAADRAAAGVAIFGKGFKDISQLAEEGSRGISDLRQQAADLGVVMSQETAVAADRYGDALHAVSTAAKGLTQQLGAALLPAAVTFTEVFGSIFIDTVKDIVTSTRGAGDGFRAFAVGVGEAASSFLETLASMVEGTTQWALDLGDALDREIKGFFALAPPILAVVRALDLLKGGFNQDLLRGLQTTIEGLRDRYVKLADGVTGAGAKIRQVAYDIKIQAAESAVSFGASFDRIEKEIGAAADRMRARLAALGSGAKAGAGEADEAFKSFGKSLSTLTAQIDRAIATGTPLEEIVRLFGEEASKAVPKAAAFGIAVTASLTDIARAFDHLADAQDLRAIFKDIGDLDRRLKAFSTKEMQDEMKDLAKQSKDSIDAIARRLETFGDTFEREMFRLTQIRPFTAGLPGMFGGGGLGFTVGDLNSFGLFGKKAGAEFTNAFRTSAANFAQQLPQALQTAVQALQSGNTIGAIAGFGGGLGAAFIQTLTDAAARAAKEGGAGVTIGETLAGQIGIGLASFAQGAQMAQVMGRFAGSLTGALAGALQGAAIAGPAGAAVGLGAGLLGGLTGPNPLVEEQRGVRASQIGLRGQLGGAAKIQEIAARMPAFEEAVRRAFTTVEVDKFNRAVGDINIALEEYNARLKGLATAQTAVNARTALYTDQFQDLIEKRTALLAGRPPELLSGDEGRKLAELQAQIGTIAARTQPEFERLGVIVASTFAGIVKQTGDGFAAIKALAPSFQALKDGVTEFGAGSTPVIDKLLGQFDLIQSEITGPFLEAVQSSGQILRGLFDAKSLDPSGFQALAADIGQNLQEVANRGGDMAQAFALSQPVLQTLFEAQQQFGAITDDTTKGILAQAEAQGIVGNQFKSTQQKTLEVLLAIADVFGAKIPEGIATTAAAATAAGATIHDAFAGGIDAAGASVGGFADQIRTQIPPAAADAAAAMRRQLEIQAFEAGVTVTATMSNAAIQSAIAIQTKVGASLGGLKGKSKEAADDVMAAFNRMQFSEHTLPVKVELDASAIDRIPDDVRIRTGFDPSGIPSFGTGAIVRKRTLAFVGESGPEAIVPLSGSGGMQPEGMKVIFEQDGRAAAEFLVPYIPGVVQRYRLA